ncbi:helix-turn-helix transcriptional regulator, partial [Bacteroidales bacterium OttesenSCG-928-I14]|nr:helix-turn-helix transcriptional regulator [Bacteroidales bacterium OttesenSCG-928-I14]
LNKLSISGTGKTVKQHLQDRLLLEAKKEIRLNNKSLKEIAFDLGFNEAAYFSRFFKKQTSLSPLQFRKLR